MTASPERRGLLQEQAAEMWVQYPELYEYLHHRDTELRRSLVRIPSPADVVLSASTNVWGRLAAIRSSLTAAGLDELGGAPLRIVARSRTS